MKQEDRIKNLKRIVSEQRDETKLTKALWYDKKKKIYKVYEIPLEYLIYNKYNGRIMSMTFTYEKQFNKLNASVQKDSDIIEKFLWDASPDQNIKTKESLEKFGQNEVGIVTKDGVIIDGNRRAMLLNLINKNNNNKEKKFLAVILDQTLETNKKEILALETLYQIGVDDKVDYNPIEKYLKCKELVSIFDVEQIAEMMNEKEPKIINWLEILKLMDEYLKRLGYEGYYIKLDKREGHFVDLYGYLNTYKSASGREIVDWEYNEIDIEELKKIYFDYIRLGLPVNKCRVIANPKKGNSFFCNKNVWEQFKLDHLTTVKSAIEMNLIEFQTKFGGIDILKTIEDRDNKWKKNVDYSFVVNMDNGIRLLDNVKRYNEPAELLNRVKSTLGSIDVNYITDSNKVQIENLINDIQKMLKKIVDQIN